MTKQGEVRDWIEDMNGCADLPPTPWKWHEDEYGEWFEDANGNLVIGSKETSFWDWVGGDVEVERIFRFFLNAPEALPHWLKEAVEWKARAYEAEVKAAAEKERADRLEERNKALMAAVVADANGTFSCLAEEREKKLREAIEQTIKDMGGEYYTKNPIVNRLMNVLYLLYPDKEGEAK